jgi:hypothetical protein
MQFTSTRLAMSASKRWTMDVQETALPPEIEAELKEAMTGKVPFKPFCEHFLKVLERQGRNYVAEGMPVEYWGETCIVPVQAALQWLNARGQRRRGRNIEPPAPKRPGRPRKSP